VASRSSFGKSFSPSHPLFGEPQLTLARGINEGRQSAREVDLYLEKSTGLPVTGGIVKVSAQEILGITPQVVVAAAT
jgi:glutamate synthase (NADPH/NADH)